VTACLQYGGLKTVGILSLLGASMDPLSTLLNQFKNTNQNKIALFKVCGEDEVTLLVGHFFFCFYGLIPHPAACLANILEKKLSLKIQR